MLFSGLPPAGLAAIIDSMQPQMVMAGKDIIKQVTPVRANAKCKRRADHHCTIVGASAQHCLTFTPIAAEDAA